MYVFGTQFPPVLGWGGSFVCCHKLLPISWPHGFVPHPSSFPSSSCFHSYVFTTTLFIFSSIYTVQCRDHIIYPFTNLWCTFMPSSWLCLVWQSLPFYCSPVVFNTRATCRFSIISFYTLLNLSLLSQSHFLFFLLPMEFHKYAFLYNKFIIFILKMLFLKSFPFILCYMAYTLELHINWSFLFFT